MVRLVVTEEVLEMYQAVARDTGVRVTVEKTAGETYMAHDGTLVRLSEGSCYVLLEGSSAEMNDFWREVWRCRGVSP